MLKKKKIPWIITKSLSLSLLAFLMLFSILSFQASSSPPRQAQQEKVTVTAVEVPVRVFLKGEVIRGLAKEDFEIFENGVKQEITQFKIVSRKISSAGRAVLPQEKPKPSKRLFLLIFNIFDYNEAIGEAINYFFKEVFQPSDQIVILVEDKVLNIERGKNLETLIANLKGSLKKIKRISTFSTIQRYQELENEADILLRNLRGLGGAIASLYPYMVQFLDNYKRVWTSYRNQFLVTNLALYQSLVDRIKFIEAEKWAICFQQREIFPRIKSASSLEIEIENWVGTQIESQAQVRARIVQAKYQDLQRSFDFSGNISTNALSDLFLGAGITYHLILLKSARTLLGQDYELKEISQDYENSLKAISRATGGYLGFSNQAAQALQEAVLTEDYHYLLVYSPKESSAQKKIDITVKVNRAGVDIFYMKHFKPAGPPPVTITNFKVKRKTISFSLRNYQMTQINDKRTGLADVKITIFDEESNKVFEEAKTLDLVKEETNISLNFNHMKSGKYFIVITAFDRVANKTDLYSELIEL